MIFFFNEHFLENNLIERERERERERDLWEEERPELMMMMV